MRTILSLKVRDKNDINDVVYFNPYTLKVNKERKLPPLSLHHTVNYGVNKPKILKIFLGNHCNLRCLYCDVPSSQYKKRAFDLNNFLSLIKEHIQLDDLEKIEFCGGEPLIYWDAMQKIMSTFNTVSYSLETNGLLLNKEIVDVLIEKNFTVVLSHDGPEPNYRGEENVLDVHKDLINVLYQTLNPEGRFFINSVLTDLCPSPINIIKFFIEQFDENIKFFKLNLVIPTNKKALKIANKIENLSHIILNDLMTGEKYFQKIVVYNRLFKYFQDAFNSDSFFYDAKNSLCFMADSRAFTTDLNGNLFSCHTHASNDDDRVGNLFELENLDSNELGCHPMSRSRCSICPVLAFCRGICPQISKIEEVKTSCHLKYEWYSALLVYFIYKFTGLKILEFCGDYFLKNEHLELF